MWTIWENFMFALQNGNNMVVAQVPSYIDQLNKSIKVCTVWLFFSKLLFFELTIIYFSLYQVLVLLLIFLI